MTDQWTNTLQGAFQEVSETVITFLPNLVIALLILIVGWILGKVLGRIVSRTLNTLGIDGALENAGVDELANKTGFQLNSGAFFGFLVKWFVILIFLIAAFEVLGLQEVNFFLREVVIGYIPQVIVAALILIASAVIADAVRRVIEGGSRAVGVTSARFFANVAKWAIWIFGFIIALAHLGIAREFMLTLFTGFVVMVALAGGIAFGLGGKDLAEDFLKKLRKDISSPEK